MTKAPYLGVLAAGTAFAAIATVFASPAYAQEQAQPAEASTNDPTAADESAQEAEDQDIVVTGSRIARPELDAPNPIVSFTAETIEQSGRTNLTDFLVQNPALIGSTTSADQSGSTSGFGATGTNLLNLRNLGTDRTLVLVDGRRHVAGLPGSASVDINTVPKDLIERIDVLTGGASAVYGADGVSGVVNFVLKRNFEGLSATVQTGISEEGDGGNRYVAITAGKNFADGRGNIALSYEFTEDDRVSSFDRRNTGDPFSSFGLVQDPSDFDDDDPNVFDRILTNNLRYQDSSRDGAIDLGSNDPACEGGGAFVFGCFDGIPEFTGRGTVYDRGTILPGTGLVQGGDSTPQAGYQGDLQPDNRIHNINLLTSFEVSEALRFFAQGKYAHTTSFSIAQPSFDFFTFLNPDNAFLVDRFGPEAAQGGALLTRDNFDLGVRGESTKRETIRGVFGVDGKISDNARYELSYTYGQTDSTFLSTNYRITDRYFAALDAVDEGQFLNGVANGNIVCRSNLTGDPFVDPNNFVDGDGEPLPATTFTPGAGSGCQPLNLIGENVASQAALDFINADLLNRYKVTQNVISGSISGDFGQFFSLPGGPIGFAIGGEYRKETSDFVSDPLLQQGALADIAQIGPEYGEFDVKEAFGEINVPLLKDLPFAETLSVGAAIRLSDYSTVGNTTTWSVNGVYAPVRDIRFRGTYSEAVRAPNITELFAPQNGTFDFIDDPCDPVNIPEGTQFRQANCATILTALGIDPDEFSPTSSPIATATLPGRSGGNPNLIQETSRTWTAGVVLRPSFLSGFTASADWYDIELRDAISTASAQELVDLCVDQPDLNNPFCSSIGRDPNTGFVNDYLIGPQNVANFATAGLDVQLNYRINLSPTLGSVNVRLQGNYLDKLTFIATPGADVDDQRMDAFAPKYSGNADVTWRYGNLTVNYGVNYFSKTRRYSVEQLRANPDISDPRYHFFKEKWEHDLQLEFNVQDKMSFYVGVNNLLAEKVDTAQSNYPVSFLGRYFYAGARIKLGKIF